MNFDDIRRLTDETEQIKCTYDIFDEDARLQSKAAQVEFLTTVRCIEQYITPGMRILDVGAGTGAYSLYFARKGYRVDAVELVERNVNVFRSKILPDDNVTLTQGNATSLDMYDDDTFDAVLVFGPLYHLHDENDREKCIAEAKRVCKPGGMVFFAFIGHDMVYLTELQNNPSYFADGDYDHETLRLHDFPFVFHTVRDCRRMLYMAGMTILREVAADGASELLADVINAMPEEDYAQYLRYHEMICQKSEFLGMSNHLLFACCNGERGGVVKYYGSPLCPDCVEATRILTEKRTPHDYVDMTASMRGLKEFLALRDSCEEFAEVRAEGRVGIPCFLRTDGSITFDVNEIAE